MAHAFVASRFGVRTTEIVMFPIGGLSRMERTLQPTEELWVSLAGPLMNLLLAAGSFGYMLYSHQSVPFIKLSDLVQPTDPNALPRLAFGNLLLAGFNLLPAFPMDGGRVLRALLCMIRPEDEATRIAAWMGRMLAISMGLYGLLVAPVHAGVFRVLHLPGRGAGRRGGAGPHSDPRHSGASRDDHGVPHAGPRQYDSRRREPAAVHLPAGLSRDAWRSSGGAAGPQSFAESAGGGRPGRLCGRSDGSRIPAARARLRSGARFCR